MGIELTREGFVAEFAKYYTTRDVHICESSMLYLSFFIYFPSIQKLFLQKEAFLGVLR